MHQSHSSHGPSLMRKRSFAQATGHRLSKTANRELCRISRILAWASSPRLSETTLHPKVRFLAWATTAATRIWLLRVLA
ncbi:hypothetical protein DEO72_LG2g1397 [Vigna unguiculata]|uniref:Uncharacterized protein n=1 Tax=Vigna unguiculata TaxID=3917 RepID=A0A4D6KWT2_VIGUN|nr:hypothetical protein DEO72_LG2g1397 [Vigna unguiculata]